MTPRSVLALLALLALLPGCTNEAFETARFVYEWGGGLPVDLETQVEAAGGAVVRVHPELDMAVIVGITEPAAIELAAELNVKEWGRDLSLPLVPGLDALPTAAQRISAHATGLESVAAAGVQGDPTNTTFYDRQWNLQITETSTALEAGFRGSPDIRVAILDTGIDPYHVDLSGLIDEAASIGITPSFAGPPAWVDDQWHGTHVAGTVVTNNVHLTGIAPDTTLIAVKVCNISGGCSATDVIAGILHSVDVGADVINMSLAGAYQNRFGGFLNGLLHKATTYATQSGVLVVAAAGNHGLDLQQLHTHRFWPCEVSPVFCISASRSNDTVAGYSNYGTNAVHIAAPGGDLGPDFQNWVLGPCNSQSLVFSGCESGDWYLFSRGTSMASPHAAGAAALVKANEPGMNAGALRARLQNSADDLGAPGADPFFGKGRLNVCSALGC